MTVPFARRSKVLFLGFLGLLLMYSGRLIHNILNISGVGVKRKLSANMTTWREQKEMFLNQSLEEKRKSNENFVTLDSIEVWKKQVVNVQDCGKYTQGTELDGVLANKVSIWKGDITRLEVSIIICVM